MAKVVTDETSAKADLWLTRWEIAKKDPWYFLRYFVETFDEHEFSNLALAKPFPAKAMYRIIVRAWVEHDVIFIEKSRQIMMTWLMAALYLHMAMFNPAKRIIFQSKNQEDANKVIDRARHMFEQLVKKGLPGLPIAKMTGSKIGTDDKILFTEIKSELLGIPQGPDAVRSITCSGLLADEMNHQMNFGEGYAAAMPTIAGGAKYTAQGTANGRSAGYRMLYGIDDTTMKSMGPFQLDSAAMPERTLIAPEHYTPEEKRRWIERQLLEMDDETFNSYSLEQLCYEAPGMRYWVTADGGDSLRVHYSADPDKDPVTRIGAEWKRAARARMKSQAKWDREMEIKYDTFEGRPVILNWDHDIFVKELEYDSEYPVHLSLDFGTQVWVTIFAQYRRIEGFTAYQLLILDELVGRNSNSPEQAQDTMKKLAARFERSMKQASLFTYCDPNGDRPEASTSDKSLNSSVKILRNFGLYPRSRQFAVIESTEVMETAFAKVLPNGQPAVLVDPRCEYLISCCAGGLHYPKEGRGREGHYEKDGEFDHGGDALRYLINNLFDDLALAGKEKIQRPKRTVIRDRVTGRIKGYRTIDTKNMRSKRRRGVDATYRR